MRNKQHKQRRGFVGLILTIPTMSDSRQNPIVAITVFPLSYSVFVFSFQQMYKMKAKNKTKKHTICKAALEFSGYGRLVLSDDHSNWQVGASVISGQCCQLKPR